MHCWPSPPHNVDTLCFTPSQVCGDLVGISAVVAAMLGLSVLLLTGVLTWRDCLTYPPAWDTLFWFAVLVGARHSLPHLCCVREYPAANSLSAISDIPAYRLATMSSWVLQKWLAPPYNRTSPLYQASRGS